METLVVYYSQSGNTKLIAEAVAKQLHADVLEIRLKREYPAKGFPKYFIGGMTAIFRMLPKLDGPDKKPGDYRNLVIGTPVWAGTCCAPIRSFLRRNRVENKRIALFVCHASSEPGTAGKCFADLKKELAGNTFAGETDFVEPLKHGSEENAKKAAEWAAGLGFPA